MATWKEKEIENSKSLKKNFLRYVEYYHMQHTFDKLYQDSKENKIFYNLLEIITEENNIKLAYRTIKANHGSKTSGVNDKTILDWKTETTDNYVNYVRKRLNNYFPHAVKRVEIPKANGKLRPLGIPTIEDRLIQQCIKQVLEPICEAKFHPNSFGFRPNRSTKDAIANFSTLVNQYHCYYVVDVDIKGFFDNVNHGKLLKQLWTLGIRDKNLLSIISKMLKAEIKGVGIPTKGTPQGGILSPLLANVVLNEFDWWIDNQWRGFETKHKYSTYTNKSGNLRLSNKFNAMKDYTNLKEIHYVRYADDFKLVCRNYKDALNIYHATKLWLKDRLDLEVSEDKSKIIYIKNQSSEFLGLSFKAVVKGKNKRGELKYVLHSHMTDKSIEKATAKLKERVVGIQKNPTAKTVSLYNSTVLGLQEYYKIATHCNLDFGDIAFVIDRVIYNRLKTCYKLSGTVSETYKKRYKGYNYKKIFIAGECLFPIHAIKHKSHMNFKQSICNYTVEGRQLIHNDLRLDINILRYLMENPLKNGSNELNDNRLSLYTAQYGKCGISECYLTIGNMEVHHETPISQGGTDVYSNLIWLHSDVHKLVHATEPETINKYLSLLGLEESMMIKLNKLRKHVGNCVINQLSVN